MNKENATLDQSNINLQNDTTTLHNSDPATETTMLAQPKIQSQKKGFCSCLKKKKTKDNLGKGNFNIGGLNIGKDGEEQSVQEYLTSLRARNNWKIVRQWVNVFKFKKLVSHQVAKRVESEAFSFEPKPRSNPSKLDKFKNFYIDPEGIFNSIWDTLTNLVLLTSMIFTPYMYVSLQQKLFQAVMAYSDLLDMVRPAEMVFDAVLILDMVANCMTAFMSDVELVTNKKIIVIHYLKTYFFLDFMANVPGLVTYEPMTIYFFHLLRYCKLPVVEGHVKTLCKHLLLGIFAMNDQAIEMVSNMIRLFFIFLLLTHLMACVWTYYGKNDDGWWPNNALYEKEQPFDKMRIYFWTITTLTSVGYGDMTPYLTEELFYTMGIMFLGMAFFGTIMAEINLMVEKGKSYEQHIEEVEEDFELWRFKLDNVIPDKRIPRYLYKQISHAMEATLDHNFRMVFYDYPFFGHMAPRIQAELCEFIFADLLKTYEAFFEGTERSFMAKIVSLLQRKKLTANTSLISPSDSTGSIYFIQHGEVHIKKSTFHHILTLSDDSFFGEICVILGIKSTLDYIVGEADIDVLVISKDEFNDILSEYPNTRAVLYKRALRRRQILRGLESRLVTASFIRDASLSSFDMGRKTEIDMSPAKKFGRKKSVMANLLKDDEDEEFDEFEDSEIHISKDKLEKMQNTKLALKDIKILKRGLISMQEQIMIMNSQIIENFRNLYGFVSQPQRKKPEITLLGPVLCASAAFRNNFANVFLEADKQIHHSREGTGAQVNLPGQIETSEERKLDVASRVKETEI